MSGSRSTLSLFAAMFSGENSRAGALTFGQRLGAGETANAPADRVVALATPANELFAGFV